LANLDERARCVFRNREVGFVFQSHHLLPQLTALENVLVPAWGADAAEERADRARALLERVGLAERCGHFPGQLSGGERQRVAVARALVMGPCLVLADEPTGALDRRNAGELMNLLLELNREEHATLVVVTHDEACAQRLGRRVAIRDGRVMDGNEKGQDDERC